MKYVVFSRNGEKGHKKIPNFIAENGDIRFGGKEGSIDSHVVIDSRKVLRWEEPDLRRDLLPMEGGRKA